MTTRRKRTSTDGAVADKGVDYLRTTQAELREDDLAALARAREAERMTRTVSLRINARTVISTTPENAERLRRLYADMLANPT